MEDINTYLEENADGKDRAAAQQLAEGFAALRLQEKVKGAAVARARMRRQARQRTLTALLLAVLLAFGLWWWLSADAANPEEPALETTTQEILVPPGTETTTPMETTVPGEITPTKEEPPAKEKLPPPPPNVPIAQAEPSLPPPPYGAPDTYLRGGGAEASEGKELLDQLWYTGYPLTGLSVDSTYSEVDALLRARKFPIAFVNLQRLDRQVLPNDTLRYLQAYTLLEMGQGTEALALIDQLENPTESWREQLQWYSALAHLLNKEKATAITLFEYISGQENHAYRRQAQKALELYE